MHRPRWSWGAAMAMAFLTLVLLVGSSVFTVAKLLFDEWQARRPEKRSH